MTALARTTRRPGPHRTAGSLAPVEPALPAHSWLSAPPTTQGIRGAARTADDQELTAGAFTVRLPQRRRAGITHSSFGTPLPATETVAIPLDHQVEAVQAASETLRDGGRALIVSAVRTGKTLTALWTAERLDSRLTVVLTPTLTLLEQTRLAWQSNIGWSQVRWLTVSSAADHSDRRPARPAAGTSEATIDRALRRYTTTLLEQHNQHEDGERMQPGSARLVVFSTYASAHKVAAAAHRHGLTVDLLIADEAHHLTGTGPHSSTVHSFPTRRHLFLTATPRTHTRRAGTAVEQLSMDDRAVFGPTVIDLRLGAAIRKGLVADYRLLIAAVPAHDLHTAQQACLEQKAGRTDPLLAAAAAATARSLRHLGADQPDAPPLRALAFCSRIDRARTLAAAVGALAATGTYGRGWAGYASGQTSQRDLSDILTSWRTHPGWSVLTNAKLFGEGITLPELDMVVLADPKSSDVDITQAVGRALNHAPGKVATIVVPVVVDDPDDSQQILQALQTRSLAGLSAVLRALREHDEELGDRLDASRRSYAQNGTVDRNALGQRISLLGFDGLDQVADAVVLHSVCTASADFEHHLALLTRYQEQHGTVAMSADTVVLDGRGLRVRIGAWVTAQRSAYRAGRLPADRAQRLAGLTGWTWEAQRRSWQQSLDAYRSFRQLHGRDPRRDERWNGVPVGAWAPQQRQRRASLTAQQTAALESIDGWAWDAREAATLARLQVVQEHVQRTGSLPRTGQRLPGPDGPFDAGKWFATALCRAQAGILPGPRAARILQIKAMTLQTAA